MRCLQCGKRISLLRKLSDGEFCSDEHRLAFQQQQNDLALARLIEAQRGSKSSAKKSAAPVSTSVPAAHSAPVVASKSAAHIQDESTPPLGQFQQIQLPRSNWRRIAWPAGHALQHHFHPALPSAEFRTLINGMGRGSGVPVPRIAAAAARTGLVPPDAEWKLGTPASVLPLSTSSLEPLDVAEEPPPFAGTVATSAPNPAPNVYLAVKVRQWEPSPNIAVSGMRWIPVREEGCEAPAPMEGAIPLTVAAQSSPRTNSIAVPEVLPFGRTPAGTISETIEFKGEQIPAVDELQPVRKPDAVPARASLLSTAVSAVFEHPAPSIPAKASRPQEDAPEVAGLRPLMGPEARDFRGSAVSIASKPVTSKRCASVPSCRPCLVSPGGIADSGVLAELPGPAPRTPDRALIYQGAHPAFCVSSAVLIPDAIQAQDSIDFWPILDRLTRPALAPKAQPAVAIEVEQLPAVEDEEPAPALHTKLCPILAWRVAEGPMPDIRVPAAGSPTEWGAQGASTPVFPRAAFRIDNAENAASGERPLPRKQKKPRKSLAERFSFLNGWRAWTHAPADLKWVALGMPLVLAVVLYSFRDTPPKGEAEVKLATSQSQSILGTQFASLQKVIMNRAAIHLLDDFRSGLSAWEGKSGWARTWKYGEATFLEPGQLALYKPTLDMRDYTVEFLGQIERNSLNWVLRADSEMRNYHVMRLVVTRPGPLPAASIVRYPVIEGKEGPSTSLPLPFPLKTSTMYRIRVEVRGKEITTYVQGQVVDSFTEPRLREGGVGFFGPKGDKALLRWVEVTHQYDYLGRLCALLAPYDVQAVEGKAD